MHASLRPAGRGVRSPSAPDPGVRGNRYAPIPARIADAPAGPRIGVVAR